MRGMIALMRRNLANFYRDRMRVVFSVLMSLFFLFVFSFVMQGAGGGIDRPWLYMIAGVAIMTVFQQAMNNSTEILNDLSTGFMKEVIVSPVPRWQISLGQISSAAVIAFVQGALVLAAGFALGVRVSASSLLLMLPVMAFAALAFASFGLFLATVSRNSGTFQVVISVVAMPLTFLSGAYIPVSALPAFLAPVVALNPLTHITSVFRSAAMGFAGSSPELLLEQGIAFRFGSCIVTPAVSLACVAVFGAAFFALSVISFSSADFSSVKAVLRRHRH